MTFTWNWGDSTPNNITTYFNDGTGPEPFYDPTTNDIRSPSGFYPFSAVDVKKHKFMTGVSYSVNLTVADDGGVSSIVLPIILS